MLYDASEHNVTQVKEPPQLSTVKVVSENNELINQSRENYAKLCLQSFNHFKTLIREGIFYQLLE